MNPRAVAIAVFVVALLVAIGVGRHLAQRAEKKVLAYGFAASAAGLEVESRIDWQAQRAEARRQGFLLGFGLTAVAGAGLAFATSRMLRRKSRTGESP